MSETRRDFLKQMFVGASMLVIPLATTTGGTE